MPMSEEARQKAAERMKAYHAAKQNKNPELTQQIADQVAEEVATQEVAAQEAAPQQATNKVEIDADVLQALMDRLAAFDQTPPVNQNLQQPQTMQMGVNGQTVGVITKYPIDPAYYPDPTNMLFAEPTLQRFSPQANYRFTWKVDGQTYETKYGTNIREPIFTVTMYRVDYDDEGTPLQQGYRLRRLQLTEDETTMTMIATELGLDLQSVPLKDLLDVARYHRIRQWVMDYFYPPKFSRDQGNTEMVDPVTGRVVLVENIGKLL